MSKKENPPEVSSFRINFLKAQVSASEAKHMLVALINNRSSYHSDAHFSEKERNVSCGEKHATALRILRETRKELDFVLLKALETGRGVRVTGNLTIELFDEKKSDRLV